MRARTCPHGHNPSRNGTNAPGDRRDANGGDGSEGNHEHALRLRLNNHSREQREAQKDDQALREYSHEATVHLVRREFACLWDVSLAACPKQANSRGTGGDYQPEGPRVPAG